MKPGMEGRPLRALLVTHGDLGDALRRAAAKILGPQPGLTAISNDGLGLDELTRRVALELSLPGDPLLVFVDLYGGSCHTAAQRALAGLSDETRERQVLGIVTGVNLPMLLTFVTRRAGSSAAEMLDLVLDRGRRGIRS
jgi:mannose PTS system EIIA component